MLLETIANIYRDLSEPLEYLPYGAVLATLLLAFGLCMDALKALVRKKKSRPQSGVLFLRWIFYAYITVVFMQTLLSREPGSRYSVNLRLFGIWGTTAQEHAWYIENVIMLLPFGFLLPWLDPYFRKWTRTVLCGAAFSVMIEVLQFLTERGHLQLDDLVTNTAGTILGFFAFTIIEEIRRTRTHRERS